MKITNRFLLKEYIQTYLGDGYTQIVDISAKSYEDAIDDAVGTFIERVYEGTEESFIEIPLVSGQVTYKMPSNVLSVTQIIDSNAFLGAFATMPGYSYMDELDMFQGYSSMSVLDYVTYNNLIDTYRSYLNDAYNYSYNSIYNNLKIVNSPPEATSCIVQCWTFPEKTDVTEWSYIYGHSWIKKKAKANILERWYMAYLKHTATLMDGGIQIDKLAVKQEYMDKQAICSDELDENYSGTGGCIYGG